LDNHSTTSDGSGWDDSSTTSDGGGWGYRDRCEIAMLFLFLFLFVFSSTFTVGGIALIVVIAFVIIRRFSLLWLLRLPTGVGSLSLDSGDLIRDSRLLRFINRDTTLGIHHDRISHDVKRESSVRVGLQDSRRNGIALARACSK
jgi:hypothetical protein